MHRFIAILIVALAVVLAVAFRIWNVDRSETPAPPPETITVEHVDSVMPDEPPVESARADSTPVSSEPTPAPTQDANLIIEGVVLERGTRQPVPGATVTVYAIHDWFDDVSGIESVTFDSTEIFDDEMAMFDADDFKTPRWHVPDELRTRIGDGVAGADGRFSIAVASGKNAFLECRAPGFAQGFVEVSDAENPGTYRITLERSGSMRGRVIDAANGQPIPGVTVTASLKTSRFSAFDDAGLVTHRSRSGGGDLLHEHETETGADGTYELLGIPAGAFRVEVDGQQQGYLPQENDATVVNIEAGVESVNADTQMIRGGFVFGKLTDVSGQPLQSVFFSVSQEGASRLEDVFSGNTVDVGSWSEVEDDGTYRLGVLEYGVDYRIHADSSDYAPAVQDVRLQPGRDAGPIDFVFAPGSVVSGMVRTASGTPASGIGLSLVLHGGNMFDDNMGVNDWGKSGDDGSFTFEHVPDGAYRIIAVNEMDFDSDAGTPVDVTNGRPVSGIEIIVGEQSSGPSEVISGTVVDARGTPVSDIAVSVFQFGGIPEDTTQTDADGRFTFDVDSSFTDTFALEAKGEAGYKRLAGVRPDTEVRLKLGKRSRVLGLVTDQRGNPMADCVVSLKSTKQNFMEFMPFSGNGQESITDEEGRFEIVDIKPGSYRVAAESRSQGTGKSDAIEVADGATVEGVRVILEPGARISGRVLDPNRQPVARARVGLLEEDGNPMASMAAMMPDEFSGSAGSATTDDSGQFTIPNVPPGSYTITASHRDYARITQPGLQLDSGEDMRGIDLMLATGGGASGVYVVDGQPVGGIPIQLVGAGGMKMLTTDADGRFDVTGLPAGKYMIIAMDMSSIGGSDDVSMGGFSDLNQKTIEIVDGQITQIDFTPPAGVAVSGSIASLGLGADVMVRLRAPDGISLSDLDFSDPVSTGLEMISASGGFGDVAQDGSFSINHVEPGQYVLEVYQQPDTSTIDWTSGIDMESIQALMPVLVYTQDITVDSAPIQVEIGAAAP